MSKNRLGEETSPYLLQHADNPVHWWAWGPEALAEAKRTGKPILLSVGYAACHWCHVMAHESFEDDATAAVMNDLFVNIKVDREERPDIDAIYMSALHRLGQQGGWPLTMFLDADARPFWGGTYFPKERAWGRAAFTDILHRISEIYKTEPEKVAGNAEALVAAISELEPAAASATLSEDGFRELITRMARAVDPINGGINGAPKFPQWTFFSLLWRGAIRYRNDDAKRAVLKTLERIAEGGIYDHLGGGFARYSVDELWLVPHFEKMLYDNALLIDLMTEAWRETKMPLMKQRIEETIVWLEREMIAEGGAFAASLDADSEGEEGKFYVWSEAEIEAVLGAEDAEFFGRIYGVTREGNFEGHTILNRLDLASPLSPEEEARIATLREKLLETRSKRIRPGWDDKVLADWNGLMIAALARAGCVFDHAPWVTLAKQAFTFIAEEMTVGDRLVHAWRQGRSTSSATASDYANMIWAARRLFEATADARYLDWAKRWTSALDRHHWLDAESGYATSADDTRDVIVRLRPGTDDATPPANAIMLSNLAAVAILTGDDSYARRAESLLRAFAGGLARNPIAHCGIAAASLDLKAPLLVVIAADATQATPLNDALHGLSLPGAIEITIGPEQTGVVTTQALEGKLSSTDTPQAFVCNGPQCSPPQSDPEAFRKLLGAHRQAS